MVSVLSQKRGISAVDVKAIERKALKVLKGRLNVVALAVEVQDCATVEISYGRRNDPHGLF